ncbi:MAG: pilus assembly protein PilM [Candidatus Babeliales bacterium]|jgi:type IV pilus assembly protein PilM
MIKEIFLPEMLGTHRILAQRVIGIACHDTHVTLALVHAKHGKNVVEHLKQEPLVPGSEQDLADRTAQALKQMMSGIKSYDLIRACIPASIVVFKELQLQFSDPEKIRMVLDYEIETMLPFSINEAIVDFIITKKQSDQKTTQILVAAVRTQDLQTHLSIYEKAGIDPSAITIDLFALYSLYQQIPEYRTLPNASALVEFDAHTTRIALVQEGQLRLTRYIPRGLTTVLKLIGEETLVSPEEILKKLTSSGIRSLGDETLTRIVQKHFVLLLNEIQFTLNSFSLKLGFYDGVSKVLFTGQGNQIPDLMTFCSDTMQIPCEFFNCRKLFAGSTFKDKISEQISNWAQFSTALGVALPSPDQQNFDLRRKQFAFRHKNLASQQIVTAGILAIALFTAIGINGYLDIARLSSRINAFETKEIERLRSDNILTAAQIASKSTFVGVIKEAERVVQQKYETWAPLIQKPMEPLELLLEITRIIDKKQFDVTIKEATFTTLEKQWGRTENDADKSDIGTPKIEIDALFKSKNGDHFTAFAPFESRFKESNLLRLVEAIEPTPAPDGGVDFTAKLILKEV